MTALHEVRVGRGYGVTVVPVFDLVLVNKGASFHVLRDDGRTVCGVRGDQHSVERSVDARAHRVGRRPVCVTCLEKLGKVPPPRLLREVPDGNCE